MMKTTLRCCRQMVVLAVVGIAAAGCGDDDSTPGDGGTGGGSETKIGSSMGSWNVYSDPYGDGGTNPVPSAIQGSAEAFSVDGKTKFKLSVSGLPASRPFGSHLHKAACEDNKAGGHYQQNPAPDGGATDPMYANAQNEVWLDFVTDAMGAGSAEATVDWTPRAAEAKAIMIHDTKTMTGGTAGAKLACINMTF